MIDEDDTFIFSIEALDADMRFETEEPDLLDDDDFLLLNSLQDELDSETD
jgi:hypothetical protein